MTMINLKAEGTLKEWIKRLEKLAEDYGEDTVLEVWSDDPYCGIEFHLDQAVPEED